MIQAIFFDVDGTLVSFRTHTIPASTLEALHALRAKGIKLFLATGRHQAMLRSVQELFPFDGCVTLSGQYCFVGSRVLRSSPMPPEAVEELVAAAEGGAFSSIFLEGEDIYLNCINDLTRQFIRELYVPMPPVRPARYALGREIYQAVTFLSREQEHLLAGPGPPPQNHPLASQFSGRHSAHRRKGPAGWTPSWTISASPLEELHGLRRWRKRPVHAGPRRHRRGHGHRQRRGEGPGGLRRPLGGRGRDRRIPCPHFGLIPEPELPSSVPVKIHTIVTVEITP